MCPRISWILVDWELGVVLQALSQRPHMELSVKLHLSYKTAFWLPAANAACARRCNELHKLWSLV